MRAPASPRAPWAGSDNAPGCGPPAPSLSCPPAEAIVSWAPVWLRAGAGGQGDCGNGLEARGRLASPLHQLLIKGIPGMTKPCALGGGPACGTHPPHRPPRPPPPGAGAGFMVGQPTPATCRSQRYGCLLPGGQGRGRREVGAWPAAVVTQGLTVTSSANMPAQGPPPALALAHRLCPGAYWASSAGSGAGQLQGSPQPRIPHDTRACPPHPGPEGPLQLHAAPLCAGQGCTPPARRLSSRAHSPEQGSTVCDGSRTTQSRPSGWGGECRQRVLGRLGEGGGRGLQTQNSRGLVLRRVLQS